MLAWCVSASVLLVWIGHADPSTRMDTLVSVIIAAPCAILSPVSHMRLISGYEVSRKWYQTDALRGTTFGWSPPLVTT